jgi:hypothetical protein
MSPDFDELVGSQGLSAAERERLRHVHDLLVRAGPPPELPSSLVRGRVHRLRPAARSRALTLLVAATLAVVAFGAGYLVRGNGRANTSATAFSWTQPLHATAAAPSGAAGTIAATGADASGNWQMRVTVTGLKPLPDSGYYVVYLVRGGKRIAPCGFFRVGGTGSTTVQLTVPYARTTADGWIVVARRYDGTGPALLTT